MEYLKSRNTQYTLPHESEIKFMPSVLLGFGSFTSVFLSLSLRLVPQGIYRRILERTLCFFHWNHTSHNSDTLLIVIVTFLQDIELDNVVSLMLYMGGLLTMP